MLQHSMIANIVFSCFADRPYGELYNWVDRYTTLCVLLMARKANCWRSIGDKPCRVTKLGILVKSFQSWAALTSNEIVMAFLVFEGSSTPSLIRKAALPT
jgi:hypothetical protein